MIREKSSAPRYRGRLVVLSAPGHTAQGLHIQETPGAECHVPGPGGNGAHCRSRSSSALASGMVYVLRHVHLPAQGISAGRAEVCCTQICSFLLCL